MEEGRVEGWILAYSVLSEQMLLYFAIFLFVLYY
jgi:hypothetical protein